MQGRKTLHKLIFEKWDLFEKRLATYFLLVLVLIFSVIVLYHRISEKYQINQSWVKMSENLGVQLDSLSSQQKDILVATRTYIITRDPGYLKAADDNTQKITKQLQRVRFETPPALQHHLVDSIENAFHQYLLLRQRVIELHKSTAQISGKEISLILQSDQFVQQFYSLISQLKTQNQALLEQNKSSFRENTHIAVLAIRTLFWAFLISVLVTFIVVYQNLVKRRKAEEAFHKSQDLIQRIINFSPVVINVKDLDGKYLLVNDAFTHTLNRQPEEIIGKTNEELVSPEMARYMEQEDHNVQLHLSPLEIDVSFPQADGMHHYIASKFPLFDEKSQLYAIGTTAMDITPVKRAHDALEKSYQQQQKILSGMQQALSASLDVLCMINDKGEFILVSESSVDLWGYTPKEMMSKRYIDFVTEADREKTLLTAQKIMTGEGVSDFTNHYRKKDGSLVPVEWSAKWLPEDQMMYCIARNASEKLKTAEQLAQSNSRLEHAQKIARLGNWDWDLIHNQWSCSDEIYRLLGLEKNEVSDMHQYFLQAIHPEDQSLVYQARNEALNAVKPFDIEHRIIRRDQQICYVHTKGEVYLNEQQKPIWLSGTMQDITDRKKAELELQQLNRALEQRAVELKRSNEELERFAYVASHDLQEPLRMVSSFLTLIQGRLQGMENEDIKKYIHFAVDGSERMKSLIQDLLKYSRLGSSSEPFTQVDLNTVLSETITLYEERIKEYKAQIQCPSLPAVYGLKTQLKQLFQNLIGNALKYRSANDPVIQIGFQEEKEQWRFSIRDNGIGIDPKFYHKIFIIFQRLHSKSEFKGNGIGLAICKKIVERHGGTIWVDSSAGSGSTFYFTLKKQNHD